MTALFIVLLLIFIGIVVSSVWATNRINSFDYMDDLSMPVQAQEEDISVESR